MKTKHLFFASVMLTLTTLTAIAQDATNLQPSSKMILPFGKKIPPPDLLNSPDKYLPPMNFPNRNAALTFDIHRPDINAARRNLNKYKQQLLKYKNEDMALYKENMAKTNIDKAASKKSDFYLVKDINSLSESHPHNFTNASLSLDFYPLNDSVPYAVLNNVAYFIADDGIHGNELWRSDGTGPGTYMVKDIEPGITSPYLYYITAINGKIYFNAYSSTYGSGVWVSDGTENGTQLLIGETTVSVFFEMNNKPYFIGSSTLSYFGAIWETDGTTAGTKPLIDVGAIGSGGEQINQPTVVGYLLFFTMYDYETFGFELWRSDGTESGTFRVSNFYNDFINFNIPAQLTSYNNKLYFSVNDSIGRKLWVSDGTTEGTIPAPGNHKVLINADKLGTKFPILNNVLYIPGEKIPHGQGLYKYDVSDASGLVKVKDIAPDGDTAFIVPSAMVVANNTLYFKVTSYSGGLHDELWISDGTKLSTQVLTKSLPGGTINNLYNGDGIFYFVKSIKLTGTELWRTVETPLGITPILISNVFKGPASSTPAYLTAFNGKLMFSAADEQKGTELFISAGTPFSTTLVKDINKVITSSSNAGYSFFYNNLGYSGMIKLGNDVLFNAYERAHGFELYKTDGTAEGTELLNDIVRGEEGFNIYQFLPKNDAAYFIALSSSGFSIYKTKGTKNSLSKLTPDYSNIRSLNVTDNGLVFYMINDVKTNSYQLWRTDGTTSGTILLHSRLYPGNLGVIGNTAVFTAKDDVHGYELWKSDGSISGTKMVKDINPGVDSSYPGGFFLYRNELYFGAYDGVNHAFWKSDGTKAGTVMVKNIDPWWNDLSPGLNERFYCISNGILYFSALDYSSGKGTELWKTDGTRAGTQVIKDINPTDSGVNVGPYYLTDVNGIVFFTADDGVHGRELWKTDGTANGTELVKDNTPGAFGSFMANLTSFAGKLYFRNVVNSRFYLWSSDGTAEDTHAVEDSGIVNVGIAAIYGAGDKLFLSGETYQYGIELYVGVGTNNTIEFTHVAENNASIKTANILNAVLYPNPVSSNAKLQITGNIKNVSVSVTDLNGRQLWQSNYINTSFINLPTEKFASGTYLITVTNGKEAKTIKLVKQ